MKEVQRGASWGRRAFFLQEEGARWREPFAYNQLHLSCYPTSN